MLKFQESPTTKAIYEMFAEAIETEQGLVTWRELTTATKLTRHELKGPLRTARRKMLSERGIVFENEPNIGYRIVADNGLADVGQKAISRARTQQRDGLKKMDCADMAKLNGSERVRHITRKTVLELGLASSKPRTIKSIDQIVMKKHNQLTSEEQIEAIKDALAQTR